jgi:hypothetical protein
MNKNFSFLFKNISIIILIFFFTSNSFFQISIFENNLQKNIAFPIIENNNFNLQEIEYKNSYISKNSIKSLIVILINFIDKINSKSIDYIKDIVFNKVNEYYLEVSYGSFSLYGNITSKWYMLNNSIKYYGSGNFSEEKHNELIEDAIKIADIIRKIIKNEGIFLILNNIIKKGIFKLDFFSYRKLYQYPKNIFNFKMVIKNEYKNYYRSYWRSTY